MNAHDLLTTDAKLIFELASRVDTPEVVAARYDLDPEFLKQMMETPHVRRAIAEKRQELEAQGFVLAQKAKLMFEDLLPDIYVRAKSKDVGLSTVLDAAKFLRTVAGLDKADIAAAAGSKFSITINLPAPAGAPGTASQQAIVVEVEPEAVAGLPPTPPYVRFGADANLLDLGVPA